MQLEATPAQLVYGRDILLPVRFQADWAQIRARRQVVINRNNKRENNKRIAHDYKVGDLVLLEKPGILPKMSVPRTGPFKVVQVHTNGTVTIKRNAVTERINIWSLTPYHDRDSSD